MTRTTTGVRLADLTTLRLGGPARSLVTITHEEELADALAQPPGHPSALVIGGGSNLVVADAGVDAPVVRIAIPGISVSGDIPAGDAVSGAAGSGDGGSVEVTIGAGENWDDVVAQLVADGLCGLAALSGIPGSTGATPVQNVGAYGTEVSDLLVRVRLFDRRSGRFETVAAADLALGYRTSALRGTDGAVVTAVTFRLPRAPLPVRYAELARTVGVEVGRPAPEAQVRDAVLAMRRSKGMILDDADPDTRSAGSFFTNPILSPAQWAGVQDRITARLGQVRIPVFPAGPAVGSGNEEPIGPVKLSAAWLIEQAGFHRGHHGPGGRVGLSTKHTLALVNRGGTTADLVALAAEIRDGVLAAFGVELHPEPVFVGVQLPGAPAAAD